ncbi:hypothetical protein L1280_000671 [Deinococcus sp. HSC-46F16]|uniref:hypothetical protein n=1 Tax=Deinococcus sp. HSC-46F16 TaxID=2910968 RepID=UPI00209D851D|nr:hypothetical protein [Deinococcus sp. HSC-46F16]MCP2013543.1 hypothetical protein [Deinococcus sp. HSC-46F16]
MTRPGWFHALHLLAALLTVLAGVAYPLRNVPGLALAPALTAHAHHGAGHGERPQTPQPSHDAHCLFCVTGAFSSVPDAAPTLTGRGEPSAHPPVPMPHAGHPAPAHADARAPPPTPG